MKVFALVSGLLFFVGCSDDSAAGGGGGGGPPSGGAPPTGGMGGAPNVGGGGEGGSGGDQGPSKRVFVSSTTFDGKLGGLVGGDSECQALADDAGLGGTWMAWLSEQVGESPSSRFTQSAVPYRLIGGAQIAADWAALIDGTLDVPINHDENGEAVESTTPVWTGTTTEGTPITPCCQDWSSTDTGSGTGLTNSTTGTWTFNGGVPCINLARLYCFEQ